MKHKIVVLSDLYWDHHLMTVTEEEVRNFTIADIEKERYYCLRKYATLIKHEAPTLVLFAGDLTGDGSCGHGYHNVFKILLLILESQEIPSLCIGGNHDKEEYYGAVVEMISHLEFAQEISNRCVQVNGLNILGIPFETSKDKRKLKKVLRENPQSIDIVLAHSELKRRTWLFDLDTSIIVTGHFDQKMAGIDGRVFISLNNNWRDDFTYATLAFEEIDSVTAEFIFIIDPYESRFSETKEHLTTNKINTIYTINDQEMKIEKSLVPITDNRRLDLNDFRGMSLKHGIEYLLECKRKGSKPDANTVNKLNQLYVYEDFKFSKTMIWDYLGR